MLGWWGVGGGGGCCGYFLCLFVAMCVCVFYDFLSQFGVVAVVDIMSVHIHLPSILSFPPCVIISLSALQ